MKTLKKISKVLMLIMLMAVVWSSNAQNAIYSCVTKNSVLLKPNVYQFDIFIYEAAGVSKTLPLNNYQLAFSIENTNLVANDGAITCSYVAGSSDLTGFLPGNVVTLFVNGKWIIRVNGPFASIVGIDVPKTGLRLGTFRITNSVDYGKANMKMIWMDTPPYFTRVFALIGGKPTVVPITHEEYTTTDIVTTPVSAAEVLCFPNPFSDQTTIQFTLPEDTHVMVDVYDVSGKHLQTLYNGNVYKNKPYKVEFKGEELATGVYLYKITTDKDIITGNMIYSKNK